MKKQISILLIILTLVSCLPCQLMAADNSVVKGLKRTKEKVVHVKNQVGKASKEVLDMGRSVMQDAFNMNFLSSVPVLFWKKSFNEMFDYTQKSIDNMSVEHKGELITKDDFQDDKALHIKKSAELALHIKSFTGSSFLAYGLTLAVGGVKELIDGSFLNPNGSRCWEDFYADMVGANAVFGKESFDKKLNKYMGSFVKENRKKNMVNENHKNADDTLRFEVVGDEGISTENSNTDELEEKCQAESGLASDVSVDSLAEKQRLTAEYYNAVKMGDSESVKKLSEELKNLK